VGSLAVPGGGTVPAQPQIPVRPRSVKDKLAELGLRPLDPSPGGPEGAGCRRNVSICRHLHAIRSVPRGLPASRAARPPFPLGIWSVEPFFLDVDERLGLAKALANTLELAPELGVLLRHGVAPIRLASALRIEGGTKADVKKFFSYFDEPVDVGSIDLIVR